MHIKKINKNIVRKVSTLVNGKLAHKYAKAKYLQEPSYTTNNFERKLLIRKLASRWYLAWYTTNMSTNTLEEYRQDLQYHKITITEEYELKLIMAELYIELLNDRIDELRENKKTKEKFTRVVIKDIDEENPIEDVIVEAPLKKGDTLQFIGDKLYVVHGDDVNAPKQDK